MGRIAGVTADETRARLLEAGATVFARRGYEGASISEICSEAGLSSGAIYAHYGSKARMFGAVLQAHASAEFDRLLAGADPAGDVVDMFAVLGSRLDRREQARSSLLVEAIVAAKRDPEVAELLIRAFVQREKVLAGLVGYAQRQGAIDVAVAPAAVARLSLMLAFGSLLIGALGPPATDHADWSALMGRLVDGFRTKADAGTEADTQANTEANTEGGGT